MKPKTGNELADALIYAAHRVRNAADARLRQCGLSLPSVKAMRALEDSDISMREISQALHVAPRTVTDLIDGLEARGLVAREPHPADRRITLLHLTEAGRKQLVAASAWAEETYRSAFSGLSEKDRQALRRLLDQVAPGDIG
jgi:DNA-binding MarR family transcriptional regulator